MSSEAQKTTSQQVLNCKKTDLESKNSQDEFTTNVSDDRNFLLNHNFLMLQVDQKSEYDPKICQK